MLEENRCPAEQRYLMVIGRYSPAASASALSAVRDYYSRESSRFDEAAAGVTEEFLAYASQFGGTVLQTCFCYADIASGRSYDLVFDMESPESFELTRAVARYNVIWGTVASRGLVDGWHQAAYFEFPGGLPKLVQGLPLDDLGAKPLIGVCDSENWAAIALELQRLR